MGREVVQRFLDAGARVAIPIRPAGPAQVRLDGATPSPGRPFEGACDATSEGDVRAFVRAAREACGDPDILVHAAGGYAGGTRVEETSLEVWENLLALNLRSAFLFARELLPEMLRRRQGRIVFVSAYTALRPTARNGAYAVAKRGLLTLMEVLAEEVKGTGVTVNAVAPSVLRPEANRAAMPNADSNRWVPTADVATTILFLCSPEAREINGATLPLKGGM